jgi:hemoglobin
MFEFAGGEPAFLALATAHHRRCLEDPVLNHPFSHDEDLGVRFVACFVEAADDAGLPDDPDLRAGLRAYMEWAVGEVLSYSPPEASRVMAGLPVPRWGWNGLQ